MRSTIAAISGGRFSLFALLLLALGVLGENQLSTDSPPARVNFLLPAHPATHMPALGLFSFGWALTIPVINILTLDLAPERRGMVSSLQSCLGSASNAVVAGVVAPLVMHSLQGLALASAAMWAGGALAWWWVQRRAA